MILLAFALSQVLLRGQSQASADDYLTRQASALRPGYEAALEALRDAPRYTLLATLQPEANRVQGQMSVTYTNRSSNDLAEIVFRLLPNAGSIYGGGALTVEAASYKANPLQFRISQDGTVLTVLLPEALQPTEEITLDLDFTTQIPSGWGQGYGILNQRQGAVYLAGWYPLLAVYRDGWLTSDIPAVGDALLAEMSFYEVSLIVPDGYQVIATGVELARDRVDGGFVHHLVSGPVRDFAVAAGADFETVQVVSGEVVLRLHTRSGAEAANTATAGLQIVREAHAAYTELYGNYPYTELDVVEGQISIGGYEFSGMVAIDEAYRLSRSPADYQYLLAHEVAHQWWYGLVGNDSINEPWLDESMATYSAALYLENVGEARQAEALVASWERQVGSPSAAQASVNSAALQFTNWGPYRDAVYLRGALFLDTLRAEMGDEAFFAFLRNFQDTNRYSLVSSQDFLRQAERAAGRPLNRLIGTWFNLQPSE